MLNIDGEKTSCEWDVDDDDYIEWLGNLSDREYEELVRLVTEGKARRTG